MPIQAPGRSGVTPQDRGRFPGFDVLAQVHDWDDVTTGVVLARLAPTTELSFFTDVEAAAAHPLCDLLLAQDGDPRIPVVDLIDSRLAAGETDGWRYEDMPPDPQAWQQTLAALDDHARTAHDAVFHACTTHEQAALLDEVFRAGQDGRPWHRWNGAHVWSLWTRYACAAFYSHPWAWNEIGFGGPAYPRGYKNVGLNARERWEVRDDTGNDRAGDPVPFAERIDLERTKHSALTGREAAPHGRTRGWQAGGGGS